jgi:predicted RNase H-like HicB family nuclease
MNIREKAETLAARPYILMTSLDETTDGKPIYIARILEVEGCFGQGPSKDEAKEDLRLALVDYIESLLEDGLPVPEPTGLVSSKGSNVNNTIILSGHGKKVSRQEDQTYIDTYILTTV